MNVLFSSELKEVKEMKHLNFEIEDNSIVFYTTVNGTFWIDEKIILGRYNVIDKYGYMACIQKEYKSLKAMFNKCNKMLEAYNDSFLSIDYRKIEEAVKQIASSKDANFDNNEEKELTIDDQIKEVVKEEKEVREEADKLYDVIVNHPDNGKLIKEWSSEYKEMNGKLDLLEKKEDELHKKKIELCSIKDKEQQNKLLNEYSNNKYKIVYKDDTVLYSNTYDRYDLSIKRVETLIQIDNWYNSVNVLWHKENTNADIIREYEGSFLTSEMHVINTDRKQVVNESYYRKDSNLECHYFGISGLYRISYHNNNTGLITIDIDAKTNIVNWYYGTMFKKGITDKGIDLFKRLKEKYNNDLDIKRFFDMVEY